MTANVPARRPTALPEPGGEVFVTVTTENTRGGPPWRAASLGLVSLAVPAGAGFAYPLVGMVVAGTEVAVTLAVAGTALFGSQALSERAFRFLRWAGNRPEPLTPEESRARLPA